jgi:hypothetical protein
MAHAVNYQGNLDPAIEVITVAASAATSQNDFVVEGPWFGVALNDASENADLSIDIVQGKRCVGYSSASVAAAVGDKIYLNPTTGVFAASPASGFYEVGKTVQVKDANNYFIFEKNKYAVPYSESNLTTEVAAISDELSEAIVKCVKTTIDAETDYSTTGKTVTIPEGAQILMVRAHATATHTSGAVTLYNGATAAHTAIAMAAAGAVTAVTAGVVQTALTVGTDAITLKTNSLGDAGIVQVWYI